MSFTSVLSSIGKDAKAVFTWLGSSKGQALITTGEGVAEAIVPQLTGIINIANTYLTEAIKTESIAAAAGVQTGSGTQKSAAVLSAVTPVVLAYAQQAGLSAPTSAQLSAANDAIVAFLNAFGTNA